MGKALYLMQKASARFFLHHLSGSNLGKMKGDSFSRTLPNMFLANLDESPGRGGLQSRKNTLQGKFHTNLSIYAEVEVLLH